MSGQEHAAVRIRQDERGTRRRQGGDGLHVVHRSRASHDVHARMRHIDTLRVQNRTLQAGSTLEHAMHKCLRGQKRVLFGDHHHGLVGHQLQHHRSEPLRRLLLHLRSICQQAHHHALHGVARRVGHQSVEGRALAELRAVKLGLDAGFAALAVRFVVAARQQKRGRHAAE